MKINYFFLAPATASASSAPGLNLATFLAAILIGCLVAGLIPVLAALYATEKVPNPTNATLPSFFLSVLVTFSMKDSNAFLAATFVISASFAIASINSDLLLIMLFYKFMFSKYKINKTKTKFFIA